MKTGDMGGSASVNDGHSKMRPFFLQKTVEFFRDVLGEIFLMLLSSNAFFLMLFFSDATSAIFDSLE